MAAGDYSDILQSAAERTGLDPGTLKAFMQIESGGDPRNVTGSYKGLFQLSNDEFQRYGGGNIFDPSDNANAAASKLAAEGAAFKKQTGRDATPADLYMVHQQGAAGYGAHVANPDGVAWQNVRRFYPNESVAKQAIWGNVPTDVRAQFPGGVDSMTSADFTKLWANKVAHFSGGAPTQVASASPATPAVPSQESDAQPAVAPGGMLSATLQGPAPAAAGAGQPRQQQQSKLGMLANLLDPSGQQAQPRPQEQPQEDPTAQLLRQIPKKPINMQQLASVLQQRARLGTA